jgi:cyclic pyranopterin phosphate synthase
MSYSQHMRGYDDQRTLMNLEALTAWQQGKDFPPVLVEIGPTHACNQRCRYCYTDKTLEPKVTIPKETLCRVMGEIADIGTKAVLLQGTGDPLMSRDLYYAVTIGAARGLSIGLTTNGVALFPDLQDKILHDLFFVRFSVVDSDPQRYAFMHGCVDSQWRQLIENITYAVEMRRKHNLKVALYATCYLHTLNFFDAYHIVKTFKSLGLDYIMVQESTYVTRSPDGKKDDASTQFTQTEIREMKESVSSLNTDDFRVKIRFPINDDSYEVGKTPDTWERNYCQGIKFYAVIQSDGEVIPCWRYWGNAAYSYGNINHTHFKDIWYGEKRKNIEQHTLNIPPKDEECIVCNTSKLNKSLLTFTETNSNWRYFVV